MRWARLAALVLAGALLLSGCGGRSAPGSASPGGAGSEARPSAAAEPDDTGSGDTDPDDTDPGGSDPGDVEPDGTTEDYLRLNGEDLLFGFDRFTVDPDHQFSQVVHRRCAPNQSRTGFFRATGWMVDADQQVVLDDRGWVGYASITLPIDEASAAKGDPWVQLELKDRGLALSTHETDPADVEGTFHVDGATATGDFLVPDLNGGPAQRVEFRVTCTEDA